VGEIEGHGGSDESIGQLEGVNGGRVRLTARKGAGG
jgi:hypothetical protein